MVEADVLQPWLLEALSTRPRPEKADTSHSPEISETQHQEQPPSAGAIPCQSATNNTNKNGTEEENKGKGM